MGAGASVGGAPLPVCEALELAQKEEIDDGVLVLQLRLIPTEDPASMAQRIFSVPSAHFAAKMQLARKEGGLYPPMPLRWMRDELIFVASNLFLLADAPCRAVLPDEIDPATVRWANAFVEVTCPEDEDLTASIAYLHAKPRPPKAKEKAYEASAIVGVAEWGLRALL